MPSLAIIQSKHYPPDIHRFYHRLLIYIDFGLPYFRKFEKDFCETSVSPHFSMIIRSMNTMKKMMTVKIMMIMIMTMIMITIAIVKEQK